MKFHEEFVAKPGEALVSVYNRFTELMNDLERNGIKFPHVTVNTKFLNCLQPEWLKAKKFEKLRDPLMLVAHTGSSSRTKSPYYVIHPSSVVDYDDDYQGDTIQNSSEDPLTSAMILLARAITQRTTVNVQCYNSSKKGHYAHNCLNLRVRDSKYFMEQMLLAKQDEAGVIFTDEQNDFLFANASRMEEIEELLIPLEWIFNSLACVRFSYAR
ncbi:hypothetical protein Tco_0546783 [Tanacetum coccineum]